MATLMYSDAQFVVNSVDLSDHVRSVTLNYEAEMLDDTTMGTSGTRSNRPGLKNWNIECTFLQDFDAGSVDATLFPLIGAVAFPVTLKHLSSATSATNPIYSGSAILESYPPIAGDVGAMGEVTTNFRAGGGSTLTRSTV